VWDGPGVAGRLRVAPCRRPPPGRPLPVAPFLSPPSGRPLAVGPCRRVLPSGLADLCQPLPAPRRTPAPLAGARKALLPTPRRRPSPAPAGARETTLSNHSRAPSATLRDRPRQRSETCDLDHTRQMPSERDDASAKCRPSAGSAGKPDYMGILAVQRRVQRDRGGQAGYQTR
jgi:hypothetical protein